MKAGERIDRGRRTALYRFYADDDALLYVGIAFTPKQRWINHASTKTWWPLVARREVTWYPNRTEAQDAERQAITSERPRYNIAGNGDPKPAPPPVKKGLLEAHRAHQRAAKRRAKARANLHHAVRESVASGQWKIEDLVWLTGWSRETIRKIAYSKGESTTAQSI